MNCLKNIFYFFVITNSVFASEINYDSCHSIDEIIELETFAILNSNQNNYEFLTELYAARGETYLLNNDLDNAFKDLFKAYEIVCGLSNSLDKIYCEFRILFNLMVCFAMKGDEVATLQLGEQLVVLFDQICASSSENMRPLFLPCKAPVIVGPDQEPYPGWCKEAVISTGVALGTLISNIPHTAAKIGLGTIIAILENKALECCAAGGLWKACVGPLAEKLNNWSKKWKILGIPLDPAWD